MNHCCGKQLLWGIIVVGIIVMGINVVGIIGVGIIVALSLFDLRDLLSHDR